ncbi:MAG: 30S ribosomal protein S9 [Proteobacteria bacterium]|nr:30S ribosomal protein S9 [Pseudomonadota bacterium]
MSSTENRWYSTGRRKRAVARVWMMPGTGKIIINRRNEDIYFPRAISRMIMHQPLELVEADEKYDFLINVRGGGLAAQADAIKHGISRALCVAEPDNRPALKKAGFLTRDAREVERKKYGQPGARKRFQYSKR